MTRRLLTLTLILGLLAGCKTQITVDLYSSDLTDTGSGKPLATRAVISAEASSQEKCAEMQAAVATALAQGFQDVAFLACRDGGFDTWADFAVAIPITAPGVDPEGALAIWAGSAGPFKAVVMQHNQAKLDAITAALPQNIASNITGPWRPEIRLVLQNDGTEPFTVRVQGAFVADKPYQMPTDFTLQRREKLDVRLSDVGNAALTDSGALFFLLQ